MIKNLCILLISVLLFEIPALGLTSPTVLTGKEIVWSGEVELTNDVIVPEGTTLTIMPGTKIYGAYDFENTSITSEAWQIIIKGDLIAMGDQDQSIVFDPMPAGLSSIKIPVSNQINQITIAPKEIDTKKIKDEFSTFRTHYVALWCILFGSIYYAVRTQVNR